MKRYMLKIPASANLMESSYIVQYEGGRWVEHADIRELVEMTGDPTPEVLNRLSAVQGYVRCGEPLPTEALLARAVEIIRDVAEWKYDIMGDCVAEARMAAGEFLADAAKAGVKQPTTHL